MALASVLIVGNPAEHPRAAREIAERCHRYGFAVGIWLPQSTTENPWASEWEALQQTYPLHVLQAASLAIVDPVLAPSAARAEELHTLRATYPQAHWFRSGLTETATSYAHVLGYPDVIAFNGLPGVFSLLDTVEIAPALTASEAACTVAREFFSQLGFQPEIVEDRIGLVIPRILAMLINEGAFTVMERVAEPRDIDTAMRLATNYPRGILEWADDIGLDTIVAILDALYAEYHQERYRACVLLRQYVRARRLGRHTGQGFYQHG